jgi:hypothetical protein
MIDRYTNGYTDDDYLDRDRPFRSSPPPRREEPRKKRFCGRHTFFAKSVGTRKRKKLIYICSQCGNPRP